MWTCLHRTSEDVPLVEFMYLVFTRMPSESYRSWLDLVFVAVLVCDVFRAKINSLGCWFCMHRLYLENRPFFFMPFSVHSVLISLQIWSKWYHLTVNQTFIRESIILFSKVEDLHSHVTYWVLIGEVWVIQQRTWLTVLDFCWVF